MTELMPWHKTFLANIEYDRVDLVKEGANSQAHIKLFKSKGESQMTFEEMVASLKPEHQAQINLVLKQKDETITDLTGKLEAASVAKTTPVAGQTEEEILKSVKDPAVKALLETSIAKTKAAEAVAKQLKDTQNEKEAIEKAKEVPNLGAEEVKLAEVYKKLKEADPALCDDVFGIFKAASALVAQGGVLTEVGKSSGNTPVVTSGNENEVWAQIEKAAKDIADAEKISQPQAISKAIKANPALYDQYLKAQQG